MSVSETASLAADELVGLPRAKSARRREEAGLRDVGELRHRLAAVGIDRALAGRADRELEPLQRPVAEADRPHDRIRAAQRLHGAAQRDDVGVMADLDRVLGADLHAGVALPALLGLLVPRLH